MLILLKYSTLTTVDGAVLTAAIWNKVPISAIIRDDNNNCVLNVDNTFTISNAIYPKVCRFNMHTSIVNTTIQPLIAKSRLLQIKGAATQLIDTSMNFKLVTQESQGFIKQISSYLLAGPSTFEIDIWTNRAGVFGRAAADGSEERYASVEITIE